MKPEENNKSSTEMGDGSECQIEVVISIDKVCAFLSVFFFLVESLSGNLVIFLIMWVYCKICKKIETFNGFL